LFTVFVPADVRVAEFCGGPERVVSGMPADDRFAREVKTRRCPYEWCVTAHGATVHPDDEDHRSAGRGFRAWVRDGSGRGTGTLSDVEVGALRRTDDDRTWVVVETGAGIALALDADAARSLGRRLTDDLGPTGVLRSVFDDR